MSCVTRDPSSSNPQLAQLDKPAGLGKEQSGTNLEPHPRTGEGLTYSDMPQIAMPVELYEVYEPDRLGALLDGAVPHPHGE